MNDISSLMKREMNNNYIFTNLNRSGTGTYYKIYDDVHRLFTLPYFWEFVVNKETIAIGEFEKAGVRVR